MDYSLYVLQKGKIHYSSQIIKGSLKEEEAGQREPSGDRGCGRFTNDFLLNLSILWCHDNNLDSLQHLSHA